MSPTRSFSAVSANEFNPFWGRKGYAGETVGWAVAAPRFVVFSICRLNATIGSD